MGISKEAKRLYDQARYASKQEAIKVAVQEYRKANPEKASEAVSRAKSKKKDRYEKYRKDWTLKKKFGISEEDYQIMLERQGGVCKICLKPDKSGRQLSVDHDHGTSRVRGLLCGACNRAIGLLCEDTALLQRAMEYLHAS